VQGRKGRGKVLGSQPRVGTRQPPLAEDREGRPANPTVSVVIPTLNEAGNLPYVLNSVPDWVDEILLVDGRSLDDTERIARLLAPSVRIVREETPGKGIALRRGLEKAKGDVIVAIDADGSMDGVKIAAFRDALVAGADYVKGSRFLSGAGSADITRFRRFGDWGIGSLIWLLYGGRYSDVTYGYFAMWRDVVPVLGIDTDGFEVETLIAIRARRARLRITEIPCFEAKRIYGLSNLSAARDGLRIFRTIVRERLRRFRPGEDLTGPSA
jgi:glycosyltransferase involved in cell wall biosynthesis